MKAAMSDCLFCKIAAKQVPARIVHEDDEVVAFEDINPQAPVHLLVIPRLHVATMNDLGPEHDALAGRLYRVAASLMTARGLAERGWRAVMNANAEAGQTVFHLHLHALGGRQLTWPPG
jgi:histidine triad (HIT) family protein